MVCKYLNLGRKNLIGEGRAEAYAGLKNLRGGEKFLENTTNGKSFSLNWQDFTMMCCRPLEFIRWDA